MEKMEDSTLNCSTNSFVIVVPKYMDSDTFFLRIYYLS